MRRGRALLEGAPLSSVAMSASPAAATSAARAAVTGLLVAMALGGCVERAGPGDEGPLAAYVLDSLPADIPHPLDIVYGAKVRLVGYRLEPEGISAPGKEVKLTLYWQTLDSVGDWQLYSHLLDDRGNRVANLDDVGPLRETSSGHAALPPSAWQRGKVYVDVQSFTVPAESRGELTLVTGLWRGNERLPILRGPGDSEGRGVVVKLKTTGTAQVPGTTSPGAARREPPLLRVTKLAPGAAPPKIDGKLDDEAWGEGKASSTGRLVDVSTGAPNTRASWNGEVRVTWDDKYLYVGATVDDPKLVGGFPPDAPKNPHLWEKECVELMIEPDAEGNNQGYFEIQISPQNLIFDSQFDAYNLPRGGPNGPFGHEEWAVGGKTAVTVDGTLDKDDDVDKGYVVEAALPWASFARASRPGTPPANGETWRINFYAMKKNDGVAWSPILGEGNFHRASRFGRVVFVTGAAPASSPSASSSARPAPVAPASSFPKKPVK